MNLQDELQRIADRAPVADVPDDTWGRARRARRRHRVAAVVAVAAVAVLAVGLTGLVRSQVEPQVTSGVGALPAQLWYVQAADDVDPAPDLAVGPVAAAFVADTSAGAQQVVAVGARDGAYRTLELPEFNGLDLLGAGQFLSLSPDGSRLAYGWAGQAPASGPTPSGVRIVDLTDGTVRSISLSDGQGVLVTRMVWSPDGRWLAWSGQVATEWSQRSRSFGAQEAAGLVTPGSTTSTALPPNRDPDRVRQYAVGDDGTVAILDPNRIAWWRDGEVVAEQAVREGVEPDTTFSSQAVVDGNDVVDLRLPNADNERAAVPTVLEHVEDRPEAATGAQLSARFRSASPLGFDGHAPVVETPATDDQNPSVWRIRVSEGATTYDRMVSEMDGPLEELTVAVALPVSDDVTAPDWADTTSYGRWWIGLVAGLAVCTAWALRRRYRAAR